MVSHLLDHSNDSRAWEVILVATLSLCSFSICSCIFFFLFSIIVHHRFGQIAFFLLVLRKIDYGLNQSCEKIIIVFAVELRIMIVFFNFDYELLQLSVSYKIQSSKIYLVCYRLQRFIAFIINFIVLEYWKQRFSYSFLLFIVIFIEFSFKDSVVILVHRAFQLLLLVQQCCDIVPSRFPIRFPLSVAIMNNRVS